MDDHDNIGDYQRIGTEPEDSEERIAAPGRSTFEFLNEIYRYHEEKGLWTILVSHISSILAVQFIIGLLFVLMTAVDLCPVLGVASTNLQLFNNNGSGCQIPQSEASFHLVSAFKMPSTVALAFGGIFLGASFLGQVIIAIKWISRAVYVRRWLRVKAQISDDEIHTMPWSEVVQRSLDHVALPKHDESTPNTPLDFVKFMMHQENYMIQMMNENILDLNWPCCKRSMHFEVASRVMEWGLKFSLIRFAFDPATGTLQNKFRNEAFEADLTRQLRWQFRKTGFIAMCLSPFILAVVFVYAFFNYAAQIRNSPSVLSTRGWTPAAKRRFRNFNEVRWVLQNRLNKASSFAERYVDQFTSPVFLSFVRFITFVGGAILGVLILLSVIDERFLTVLIGADGYGRTVLWIIGILGTIIGVLRLMLPPDTFVYEPSFILEVLARLQYRSDTWVEEAHTRTVRDEFYGFYQYQLFIFLSEVYSVIVAPLIFIFSLPLCADKIVHFFRTGTDWSGPTPCCAVANFELKRRGGAGIILDHNKPLEGDEEEGTDQFEDPTQHNKLIFSILSFKANYPSWEPVSPVTKSFIMQVQQRDTVSGSVAPPLPTSSGSVLLSRETNQMVNPMVGAARATMSSDAWQEETMERWSRSQIQQGVEQSRKSRTRSYNPPEYQGGLGSGAL